ncbi:NMD3-related protein [Promethearchaeum syntrophicum]|uniref:NMD3-related protein n=1 Tax=Promethearchaeum syntrophicum TaxID=2594042 RepID=A0A5B9D6U3_9ARCH|nr:NMD3-related protein [Candidatus Prometheoarchaeum syntrophicum]QEE14834.1 NMD3 family protein [Candidatus Prometheoarchaeum syntrophicum]
MKLRKFCAKCGRPLSEESNNYNNYLCTDCNSKIIPNYIIPEKFTLRNCIYCGAYSLKTKDQEYSWQYKSLEIDDNDFLKKILKENIFLKFNKKFNVKSEFSFENPDLSERVDIKTTVSIISKDLPEVQEELLIKIRDINCPYCAKRSGGRFDAIVQIRIQHQKDEKKLQEILAYCLKIEEKENFKRLSNFISKIDNVTNGFDLKVSTNAMARVLIARLRKKYHFEIKVSKKLIGVDSEKGSDLYRLSTLLRLIPVDKNDLILFEGIKYYVKSISKNRISLQIVSGGKIKNVKYSDFQGKKWLFLESN